MPPKDANALFERLARDYSLCDGCFGRQFSLLAPSLEPWEIGHSIKSSIFLAAAISYEQDSGRGHMNMMRSLARSNFQPAALYLKRKLNAEVKVEPCHICGADIKNILAGIAQVIVERLRVTDVKSFKVGSSFSASIIKREDEVKQRFKIPWGESIKASVNYYLDRTVSDILKIASDAKEPDVIVVVKPLSGEVSVSPSPLYFKGNYRKYEKGISQTRKRGKDPLLSIEGILASVIVPETKAADVKFHGAGREDVDALMLGPGRPFVLEVVNPLRRSSDPSDLRDKINESFKGRIELLSLGRAIRSDVQKVKLLGERVNKVYRAMVRFGRDVSEQELKELEKQMVHLQINQRTPTRVMWRRADKVRRKTIISAEFRRISPNTASTVLVTQGGTYIKEFISGDSGRTTPSLSESLNTTAECVELEVIDFLGEV